MESATSPSSPLYASDAVRLVAWVMLALVVLSIGTKFTITTVSLRDFPVEDYAILAALVMDIGFTASLSVAAPYGIELDMDTAGQSSKYVFEKAMYASDVFFVAALAGTQLSVVSFLFLISPIRAHKRYVLGFAIYFVLCNIAFLLTALFPCSAPGIWLVTNGDCIDQTANWTAFYVFNSINEICLVGLPIYIMWSRSFQLRHKLVVIFSFGFRILVIPTLIASIVYLHQNQASFGSGLQSLSYNVCRILVVTMGAVTVCIPYVRNLFIGLQSGMMQTGRYRLGSKADPATMTSVTVPTNRERIENNQRRDGSQDISTFMTENDE